MPKALFALYARTVFTRACNSWPALAGEMRLALIPGNGSVCNREMGSCSSSFEICVATSDI